MSTIFSTVLIASPPAFLAGWLLSKALFRQLALQRSLIDAGKPAKVVASAVTASTNGQIDQAAVKKVIAERQAAQQQVSQLRDQLNSAQQRLQPLQGEVQLLKEAVAEREHQVLDLRRKLQVQGTPPEVDVRAATDSDSTRARQSMQALRDLLTAQEQLAGEQTDQLVSLQKRLQSTIRRAHKWRLRFKPFLQQIRQQRAMINELREELRQRKLHQQQSDAAQSQRPVAQSPQQPVVEQPSSLQAALHLRSDYSSINQENLQILRGLGPALHKKLNEAGIYRLGQLAAISVDEYYRLSRSLGVAQKTAVRNDWPACARELLGMVPAETGAEIGSQQQADAQQEN